MHTSIYNLTRLILTAMLAILFALPSRSQAMGSVQVHNFELSAQLPSSSANFTFQGRNGIIWLGTKGGLSRYDGYNVQTFRSNITFPNMLPSNNVLTMAENRKYYLVGTAKGLAVLDKKTLKTQRLPFTLLNDVEIRSIAIDRKGYIWAGSYRTLLRLSPDLTKCEDMSTMGAPHTSVNQVYVDRQGGVWALFWEKGMYKYDAKRNRFRRMGRIGQRDNPFRILQKGDGSYIVTTWGNGLFAMSANGNISKISNDRKYDALLSHVFGIVPGNGKDILWMVENNNLIVARTNGHSLDIIDSKSLEDVAHRHFNSIFKDRHGNIWLSTRDGGFIRIDTDRGAFASIPLGLDMSHDNSRPYINSVFHDGSGLWYAVNNIGIGYDNGNGPKATITPESDESSLAPLKNVAFITRPSFLPKNRVWMLLKFQNRIFEIERNGNRLSFIRAIDIDNLGLPLMLFEDSKGNLWLATNLGVAVRQRGTEKFKPVESLKFDDVCSIAEDSKGRVWFASENHGLAFVKTGGKGKNGNINITERQLLNSHNSKLTTNHTEALAFDKRHGKMWIGLDEGAVFSYNTTTGELANHSQIIEGCMRGDLVNIVPDKYGRLWISSAMDIVKYDPEKRSINVCSSDNTGVDDFSQNAFTTTQRHIIFAGRGGAVCMNAAWQPQTGGTLSHPIVSDLKAGGISIYQGLQDEKQYKLDNDTRSLALGSDARNIEIDFTTCEYGQRRRIVAYMLEGIDHNWNYCGERSAAAYYSEIPAGTHRLLIRSTDENGQWTDNTTAYTIYKKPHIWATWWAYLIYIAVVCSAAYIVFTNARQRVRERQHRQIDRIERQKEEELMQTKLRYFTNISHDFLTPITVIKCIIDEMRNSPDTPHEQIGLIQDNLKRLQRLIQQVLDFRKMENGKMELAVSDGCLNQLVTNVCHCNFEPLANKKGLRFTVHTPDGHEVNGFYDADKVEKILINLLSNAFKYTERGEISVSLDETAKDGGKRFAAIEVSDTGTGIAPKDMKHIFDRFYTARMSRSDSNGVGLSFVKEIAQMHHADISVRSEVGKGSTFTLLLPLDKDSYLPNEISDKSLAADMLELHDMPDDDSVTVAETTSDNRKMLIVEDNKELLAVMQRIFSHYHNVLTARNGEEGIAVATAEQPDITVSDVMMPVMDGLAMCRKMKATPETSHIPIILLTARTSTADRIECYEAGADGYIAKPFELDVLKARIEGFLRQRHEQQQAYRSADTTDTGQLQMSALDKRFMEKATKEVEAHIGDEDYDIGQLADAVCMSKSTLYRKIKGLTNMSPVEFLRSMRLKKSLRMINEDTELSLSEIADACGFSTLRYFSRCFKEEFGVTPSEMRRDKDVSHISIGDKTRV